MRALDSLGEDGEGKCTRPGRALVVVVYTLERGRGVCQNIGPAGAPESRALTRHQHVRPQADEGCLLGACPLPVMVRRQLQQQCHWEDGAQRVSLSYDDDDGPAALNHHIQWASV